MFNIYQTISAADRKRTGSRRTRVLVGKAKYAEDAAAMMLLSDNRVVTWCGRIVLDGRDLRERAAAAESYDWAARVIEQRQRAASDAAMAAHGDGR